MTVHYKVGGEWLEVSRPYVKVAGIWTPVQEVATKDSGVWETAYEYDVTPPSAPLVSLELVETNYQDSGVTRKGRHIKVGVRQPELGHQDEIKMIRVLTTYNNAAPTTQYGGTYTRGSQDNAPNEPWSDFSYNGYNGTGAARDTSEWRYKTWVRNATNSSQLEGQQRYYFTAWALDFNGNWSVATPASIWVPAKSADGSDFVIKEARFTPNYSGSYNGSSYGEGDLTQSGNPRSWGLWFYGTQFNRIGEQGTAAIRNAQIQVIRENDSGNAQANVYLFWHEVTNPGALPVENLKRNTTLVGTIGKGESKWIDLPEAFLAKLADNSIKGFGLSQVDPIKAASSASDYSVVQSLTDNLRSGEVHVVWTETP